MSTGEGKREELTTSFVLHSFHFCQQMRILITAEVDAVDPGFNLLPKQEASSSSSIDCGGEYCSYKEQDIGSNACYIHSCAQLSLLEQQLVFGCPPLVELKSHSISHGFHWGEAADQMLLGGVKMLLKADHFRGSVQTVDLLPYEFVRKQSGSRQQRNDKWRSLLVLLQHLHKHAEGARNCGGDDVGCIEVTHDGRADFLTIKNRHTQKLRISRDSVLWLQSPSGEPNHSNIETGA